MQSWTQFWARFYVCVGKQAEVSQLMTSLASNVVEMFARECGLPPEMSPDATPVGSMTLSPMVRLLLSRLPHVRSPGLS